MGGRQRVPGEKPNRGILDPHSVRNRTIRGVIDGINTDNGFASLTYDGLPSSGRCTSIPWLWASFPEEGVAAWGRYMPYTGDTLKIAFDYDETPHAIGYETRAGKMGIGDGRAGHPEINAAADSGAILQFTKLQSGEYDFMSAGGSYIYGSNTGELLLSGGDVSLDLVKFEDIIIGQSGLYNLRNDSSYVNFGNVRRFDDVTGIDSSIGAWNPTGINKELNININHISNNIQVNTARFGIGNLATDTTIELTNLTSLPKLLAIDLYDETASNNKIWSLEVDNLGSTNLDIQDATLVTLNTPKATVTLNNTDIVNNTSDTYAINTDIYTLEATGSIDIASIKNIVSISGVTVNVNGVNNIQLQSPQIDLVGNVKLGSASASGGVLNGTNLKAGILSSASSAISLLSSLASTWGSNSSNVLHSEIAPILTILSQYLTDELSALDTATSPLVSI
jgi:hypothetical protein